MSELKEYTMDEVSKHNTAESLWIVADGNVYDVTKFLHHHPAGKEPLLNNGGKDISAYFQKIPKH